MPRFNRGVPPRLRKPLFFAVLAVGLGFLGIPYAGVVAALDPLLNAA